MIDERSNLVSTKIACLYKLKLNIVNMKIWLFRTKVSLEIEPIYFF